MELPNLTSDEKALSYDLRQTYAKIVGEHLEAISEARQKDNYPIWYKYLLDLFTITKHKFKKQSDIEDFEKIKKSAISLANEHRDVWTGLSKEENDIALIEETLHKMEAFLYRVMDEANMFGTKFDDQDL